MQSMHPNSCKNSISAPHTTGYAHSETIAALPLFHGIPEETIHPFSQAATTSTHDKGNIIFMQHDRAEWLYVLLQGWVKLFRESLDGSEAVLDILSTGAIFGEHALFDEGHYSISAEAIEQATLLRLPMALLKQHIQQNNRLALNMLQHLSLQNKNQSRDLQQHLVQSAPQRIGCFLLRLCPTDGRLSATIQLPYDKTLLAARLGMQPETFSRALSRLKQAVALEVKGSSIIIPS